MQGLELAEEPEDGTITVLVPAAVGHPRPPIILSTPTPPLPAGAPIFEQNLVQEDWMEMNREDSDSFLDPTHTPDETSPPPFVFSGEYAEPDEPKLIEGVFSHSTPSHNPFALRQARSDISAIAHTLQLAAQQIGADPTFDQNALFRTVVPIIAFLYALVAAVFLPRYFSGADDSSDKYLVTLAVLGLVSILVITRAILWGVSLIVQSFCALDVDRALKTGKCVDSAGQRFSQADLLVGGLLSG